MISKMPLCHFCLFSAIVVSSLYIFLFFLKLGIQMREQNVSKDPLIYFYRGPQALDPLQIKLSKGLVRDWNFLFLDLATMCLVDRDMAQMPKLDQINEYRIVSLYLGLEQTGYLIHQVFPDTILKPYVKLKFHSSYLFYPFSFWFLVFLQNN